ncbi:MAG: bifunctional diaminohydroxyphosphoribosylaminopyrimidine deaminase/5-amino-6-(5-phosphoribosylamino)uracil reductase RibD [Deltaproteobacteria bacterium]|nr:bifunctional diaminohydroxyphosphoribosylaminopyrimidine deaminase/5-amino-6-(5-phosphoribosylamino)uracil reductase RibD [Deltaproteobacteria bacterium]
MMKSKVARTSVLKDEFYMKAALRLARKGEGRTSPNPMVGAVIVRGSRIVGQGYHRAFGDKHAETRAIESASGDLRGTTFYITLEPCSHFGKTPPCVDRILEIKPSRVVVGSADPNPRVSGKSIRSLRRHGIEVTTGILEKECRALNEVFFKYMTTGYPFVTVKYAQTLDGRIATRSGHSRWISSPPSLTFAHRLRSLHDSILVGSETILKDDPELTCRLVKGRNPRRVIVDSSLKIPLSSKVLLDQDRAKTMIFTTTHGQREKLKILGDRGVDIRVVEGDHHGRLVLRKLLKALAQEGISSILVEGGSRIITSFLKEGLADRLVVITAPKILGKGIEAVGDLGIDKLDRAIRLDIKKIIRNGDDIVLDARIKKGPPAHGKKKR